MLVVLRLALGWHFLYEGVFKITHRDQFVAETEGFLGAARGPASNFFYGMVPDIDGHQRLEKELAIVEITDADGKKIKEPLLARMWDEVRQRFVDYYKPVTGKDEDLKLHAKLAEAAEKVYKRHVKGLEEFIADNGDKITAHFAALQRFGEQGKTDPNTDFMRQRRWDAMQEFRKEAKGWLADLDSREKALKADLMELVNKEPKDKGKEEKEAKKSAEPKSSEPKSTAAKAKESVESGGEEAAEAEDAATKTTAASTKSTVTVAKSTAATVPPVKPVAKADAAKPADAAVAEVDFTPLAAVRNPAGPFAPSNNPLKWKKIEQLAWLLSYAMFAVGLCLMLGLFTRLAALAGACFMLFVVFSQPSYPGVYPLDPPQLGHALVVNKDFIEMTALLVIASTRLGRWTGLDFFLHNCLIKPFCCRDRDET